MSESETTLGKEVEARAVAKTARVYYGGTPEVTADASIDKRGWAIIGDRHIEGSVRQLIVPNDLRSVHIDIERFEEFSLSMHIVFDPNVIDVVSVPTFTEGWRDECGRLEGDGYAYIHGERYYRAYGKALLQQLQS